MNIIDNLIIRFLIWRYKAGNSPRLKKWLELEVQKEKVIKAIGGEGNFPSELFQYLSIALGVRSSWYEKADWTLLVRAFYLCLSKSPQVQLPITSPTDEKKSKEDAWEYDGRTWHLYSHLLAKNYGWTLEYISQLRVEEALSKIQEIVVDEQLDREFYYGLSEVAYAYDKTTKKSRFVPLPRPAWMRPRVSPETIKKVIIPASMLPVGNVIMDGVLPPEFLPKEIIH